MKTKWMMLMITGMLSISLVACEDDEKTADVGTDDSSMGDTDSDTEDATLEIVGNYVDDWGGRHTIGSNTWVSTFPGATDTDAAAVYTSVIAHFDNVEKYVILDNGDGTFGRNDWFVGEGVVYYCSIEYAATSFEVAKANETADNTDLVGAGCNGFAWTAMTPVQ